ncbi:MAG: DUF1801 domain-containing protein [Planctomycetota bacterium]
MAENKTKATTASVREFLDAIPDERRREDCRALAEMMRKATRAEPKMWGPGIVGFGDYHYVHDSGREGDWFLAGFSPRKQNLTLYLMGGLSDQDRLLAKLGKHKTGKGCLYIDALADIDLAALRELIQQSVQRLRKATRK